jgi:chromosome segregation ATPase
MSSFPFRQRGITALTALLVVTLSACTDTASRARADSLSAALANASAERDSLQGLMQGTSADKDRALAQVVEASKFADEVDAELRKVRGLSSKVGVTKSDESGKTEAAAAQKDILDRLTQMRQRLAARQRQVTALLDTLKTMRADSSAAATLLADLNARLATRDKEIAAFQDEIRALRTQNERLTVEKAVLTDTV